MGRPVRWGDCTAEEVGAAAREERVAVLPVGATEQHGPHLATGTDTTLAEAMAAGACERTGDLLLPVVAFGCSLGHTDKWPGTLSLSPATLTTLIEDIGDWLFRNGFGRLVIVNGHATNGPPCESAMLQLRFRHPELMAKFVTVHHLTPEVSSLFTIDAEDLHANATETAAMLHVRPELVHIDRAVDEEDRTIGRVFPYAMPDVTHSGVVGSPSLATPELGEDVFDKVVVAITELLVKARAERPPLQG